MPTSVATGLRCDVPALAYAAAPTVAGPKADDPQTNQYVSAMTVRVRGTLSGLFGFDDEQ